MKATRVLETCLYANDLDAAETFYHDVLGLEVMSRVAGRHVFFRCGDAVFLVFNPATTRHLTSDMLGHGSEGSGHVAFVMTEAELDAWSLQLKDRGVAVEKVVRWPSGDRSLYFRDPAGNLVELAPRSIWPLGHPER